MEKKFTKFAATENNPKYSELIERESSLYGENSGDYRTPFERDYTRILHSQAYRRLKHKTQVFYNIESDHICTRMEHVLHVESASYTIAKRLGLNEELTRAIAMGHDIGHAPFGHEGEKIIEGIYKDFFGKDVRFWHEKNGLYFAEDVELLPDRKNVYRNLNLTYAVRDGIISHCGEADEKGLFPREKLIDLKDFTETGMYAPATYEGCAVKLSDKIAYLGRDIEDAINLGFLTTNDLKELSEIAEIRGGEAVNTGAIMSEFIADVCETSSPECGITLSDANYRKLTAIKTFNYEKIYKNERFEPFKRYASLVINELFSALYSCTNGGEIFENLNEKEKFYPKLIKDFKGYVAKYVNEETLKKSGCILEEKYENKKIYGALADEKTYAKAVLDFISGMTDRYAVSSFNELITY